MAIWKPLRRSPFFYLLVLSLILFLIAYPKPNLFIKTIRNLSEPPIDPLVVTQISDSLPNDPTAIEAWVFDNIARDANDYANWGVIFYFASPEEVLSIGRGACYARAIVLVSLLESKSIPFTLYFMPGHMWVNYQDREPYVWIEGEERIENPSHAIMGWYSGRWHFQGFGWLPILPRMLAIQFQLYTSILPLWGKIAIIGCALGVGWLLYRRIGKGG